MSAFFVHAMMISMMFRFRPAAASAASRRHIMMAPSLRISRACFVPPALTHFHKKNNLIRRNALVHAQGRSPYRTTALAVHQDNHHDNDDDTKVPARKKGAATDIIPTWTYTPYQPTAQRRRNPQRRPFSGSSKAWNVPNQITIPEDKIGISFQRSSGAGGQNVNKVNTKVELRFKLSQAHWLPEEVRQRLQEQQANRINSEGYFAVHSQEHRTQSQNRKAAIYKLQELILLAYPRPKERKLRTGVSKATKERNKEQKRRRGKVKANRGRVDY